MLTFWLLIAVQSFAGCITSHGGLHEELGRGAKNPDAEEIVNVANSSCKEGVPILQSRSTLSSKINTLKIVPLCNRERKTCNAIKQLPNWRAKYSRSSPYLPGTVVKFFCDRGYKLIGNRSANCMKNGRWSAKRPKCAAQAVCLAAKAPTNGAVRYSKSPPYYQGVTITYSCRTGYRATGEVNGTCTTNRKWSIGTPECSEETACPAVKKLSHGNVKYSKSLPYKAGTSATFSCIRSYHLIGQTSVTCTESGEWSEEIPKCLKECAKADPPSYGLVSFSQDPPLVQGTNITYSCRSGYQLRGKENGTCTADGEWSILTPKCEVEAKNVSERSLLTSILIATHLTSRTPCVSIRRPPNGYVRFSNRLPYHQGTTATFSCNFGYRLIGRSRLQCMAGGRWSDVRPRCQRETAVCPNVAKPSHGYMDLSPQFTYKYNQGTEASFRCFSGYTLVGNKLIVCQPDGRWSATTPRCVRECPKLEQPRNGYMRTTQPPPYVENSVVTFQCAVGYVLKGVGRLECSRYGKWSSDPPKCEEEPACPAVREPSYGDVEYSKGPPYIAGTSATFSCSRSYNLIGQTRVTCTASGAWSDDFPKCVNVAEPATCNNILQPSNGYVRFSNRSPYHQGTTATFSCNFGYQLIGTGRLQCLTAGRWSDVSPRCEKESAVCPLIAKPLHGYIDISPQFAYEYNQGTKASFRCFSGYTLVGNKLIVCQPDGKWSAPTPRCTRECPKLEQPHNGYIRSTQPPPYVENSVVTFQCAAGYVLEGVARLECSLYGIWSSEPPKCKEAFSCETIQSPPFGHVSVSDSWPYDEGTTATFTCDHEYSLIGKSQLQCLSGRWSDVHPRCDKEHFCDEPNPVSHGTYFPVKDKYSVGETVKFGCVLGFILEGPASATCVQSSWSDSVVFTTQPVCKEIFCTKPEEILHGTYAEIREKYTVGETIRFSCRTGYMRNGPGSATCIQLPGMYRTAFTSPPVCIEVFCRRPGEIAHGNYVDVQEHYNIGQTITFSCQMGFVLHGPKTAACVHFPEMETAVFTANPVCKRVICNKPKQILHGHYSEIRDNYMIGETITFTCEVGYIMEGAGSAACVLLPGEPRAVFTSPPICRRVVCAKPKDVVNGIYNEAREEYVIGETITFVCDEGFILDGPKTAECLQFPGLSLAVFTAQPVCNRMVCDAPTPIRYGKFVEERDNYTIGQTVTFTCEDGFTLEGPKSAACVFYSGTSQAVFTTQPVCIEGGWGGWGTWSRCSRSCGGGTQDRKRSCLGRWPFARCANSDGDGVQQETRICEDSVCPVECSPPEAPLHGYVEGGSAPYYPGFTTHFGCNDDHFLDRNITITCLSNGLWSNGPPACLEMFCGKPTGILHGSYAEEYEEYAIGETIRFACENGFVLTGPDTATCIQIPGSSPLFTTHPVCTEKIAIAEWGKWQAWSDCSSSCGYGTKHRRRICSSTNQMSNCTGSDQSGEQLENQTCIDNSCPEECKPLETPLNGYLESGQTPPYIFGTVLSFACKEDFFLNSNASITCLSNGTWSGNPPKCLGLWKPWGSWTTCSGKCGTNGIRFRYRRCNKPRHLGRCSGHGFFHYGICRSEPCVECPTVEAPLHGFIQTGSAQPHHSGDQITFKCEDNFSLEGNGTITCLANGDWSGRLPNCTVATRCFRIQPPENGDMREVNQTLIFTCDPGYTLYGESTSRCLQNGKWSSGVPYCKADVCKRDLRRVASGRNCRKSCKDVSDCSSPSKRCLCDDWCGKSCFNPNATCEEPKKPMNGYIISDSYEYGHTVTYGCRPGFILSGPSVRVCESDKAWSGYQPACVPHDSCGEAGDIGNIQAKFIPQKVMNGNDVKIGAWPWQVLLVKNRRYVRDSLLRVVGGGSIISARWILTAAHIFDHFEVNLSGQNWNKSVALVLGITDFRPHIDIPNSIHCFEPALVKIHDLYQSLNFDHDIALVKIGRPLHITEDGVLVAQNDLPHKVEFGGYIRPVCLPCMKRIGGAEDIIFRRNVPENFDLNKCKKYGDEIKAGKYNSPVIVTGFGHHDKNRVFSGRMKQGLLRIMDDAGCVKGIHNIKPYFRSARYTSRMFCTRSGEPDSHVDPCYGDSGGPMVTRVSNASSGPYWEQLGIVSWGLDCVTRADDGSQLPGYYTNIITLMPWILQNMT